ncbi:hypothetical protein LZ30DRAFT_776032 [Colletotrichum cereale]|nr:hypothetical protein LZ30DRAFT_776032 [Colletotrichum cereale]
MCFYRGTIYKCNHSEFGVKVSDCKDQRDFLAGTTMDRNACAERRIHSMNRVRVDNNCRKCQRLDALRARTRKTFLSLQENLEKRRATIGKSDKEAPKADEASKDGLSSGVAAEDFAPAAKENTLVWSNSKTS